MTGPRWRELADVLAADIRSGRLSPGDKLPSLAEWSRAKPEAYSQTVTMRAYRELEANGLVVSIHGRGTFVADSLPPADVTLEERVARLEKDVTELKQHNR